MLDNTPIEPLQRYLRSPFNGEKWPVPPDMSDEMYAELLKCGFKEIVPKAPRKDKSYDK